MLMRAPYHPAAAHLEGKPRQWVFLGARNHREKAQGHGQTTHSNHVTPPDRNFRYAFLG